MNFTNTKLKTADTIHFTFKGKYQFHRKSVSMERGGFYIFSSSRSLMNFIPSYLLSSAPDSRLPPCSLSSSSALCLCSLSRVCVSFSRSSLTLLARLSGVWESSRVFSSNLRSTMSNLLVTDNKLCNKTWVKSEWQKHKTCHFNDLCNDFSVTYNLSNLGQQLYSIIGK